MPNFDKTGPMGEGPNTGRGQGDCNDNQPNSNVNSPRRGFGFGRGFRRGFGRCFGRCFGGFGRSKITKADLQEYKENLKEEIEDIDEEINNLKD